MEEEEEETEDEQTWRKRRRVEDDRKEEREWRLQVEWLLSRIDKREQQWEQREAEVQRRLIERCYVGSTSRLLRAFPCVPVCSLSFPFALRLLFPYSVPFSVILSHCHIKFQPS